ncbi:MAG: lipopolysaccharide assembly protein LapA domain-containing protein [Sulfuricella sp.]|nr:lipopolysaccharide assembly protein LapA domain-containing protein [Sulfuricella sp.]
MQLTIIAAILAAIAGVIFAMQNNVPVTANFLFWRFDSSLALVLLLALAAGAIIIALLTTPATLRRQWLVTRQKRRIDELERTCKAQKEKIVALEQGTAISDPAPEKERPYIGLKQIIAGGDADEKPDSGSS